MEQVKITLKDGSVKEVNKGVTLMELAASLSRSLAKSALAAKVNGKVVDLTRPIQQDAAVEFLGSDTQEGLDALRHSASHIMAQAVQHLFGDEVQFGIGPWIANGFYYDIDTEHTFVPEDLAKIEAEKAVAKA